MYLSSIFLLKERHLIVCAAFAFGNVAKLAAEEHLTHLGKSVDVDMAFQVVIFMLDDARADALKHILVLLKIFVKIMQSDFIFAHNIFAQAWQTQTTFLEMHVFAE